MKDDLERRLEEMYRGLDAPARRLAGRWRARYAPRRTKSALGWAALAAASAAAVVLILVYRPGREKPSSPPATVQRPKPQPEKEKTTADPHRREENRDVPPKRRIRPPAPQEEFPKPEERREEPRQDTEEPKKDADPPRRTEAETPTITFREAEGSFELAGRSRRGRERDVKVVSGDRIRTAAVSKLSLSEKRFLLIAAKSDLVVHIDGEALVLGLEQGEILAELLGPGVAVRVQTAACRVDPKGTVFSVRCEAKKTVVLVEEGLVECSGSGKGVTVRPGQQTSVATGGAPAAPSTAELQRLSWTRGHRPAERTLFSEDFTNAGAWEAQVEKGVARGVADPQWCAAKVRLESADPLWIVPVRSRVTIVCRTDRTANLVVQMHAREPKMNFLHEVRPLKAGAWQTVTFEFERCVPRDSSRTEKLLPGAPIDEIYLLYGEPGDKGSLWVDSITVTELRP